MTGGRAWVTGLCWKCEKDGVPVLWLGPAHSDDHGQAPFYACEPCTRRVEALIAKYVAERYAAT